MGLLKVLVALMILAAGAAYVTRPGEESAEAALKDQLMQALDREEISPGRGAGANVALGLCKLKPTDCYQLVRAGIETRFTDHTLFTRFDMAGFGKTAQCIGAFTTFHCPGGLRDAP